MKKQIRYDKRALKELHKFSEEVQDDFIGLVESLEKYGKLEFPDGKKIGKNMFEMRVKLDGAYRGIYGYIKNNEIIILHFFEKKSQKTPMKNFKTAEQRLKRYA